MSYAALQEKFGEEVPVEKVRADLDPRQMFPPLAKGEYLVSAEFLDPDPVDRWTVKRDAETGRTESVWTFLQVSIEHEGRSRKVRTIVSTKIDKNLSSGALRLVRALSGTERVIPENDPAHHLNTAALLNELLEAGAFVRAKVGWEWTEKLPDGTYGRYPSRDYKDVGRDLPEGEFIIKSPVTGASIMAAEKIIEFYRID